MPTDRPSLTEWLATPTGLLLVGLGLAAALIACPASWTAGIKGAAARVLHPGQTVATWLREQGREVATQARNHLDTAARLGELQQENARLVEENSRLAARLAVLEHRQRLAQAARAEEEADAPLLKARGIKARVLGHAVRDFLGEHHLLNVGAEDDLRPDALVLEDLPGLIDQGDNAALESGELVLGEGRVWGKVVEVGPQTSIVRRVTEPGYRDLVRLATPGPDPAELRWGPQGILEGTGEPRARIRLIEVTEPVAVGDLVYSTAAKGLLPEPPLCGRVVAVERPVGAAHWDIWMEPAVAPEEPDTVVVVRAELNPARGGGRRTKSK